MFRFRASSIVSSHSPKRPGQTKAKKPSFSQSIKPTMSIQIPNDLVTNDSSAPSEELTLSPVLVPTPSSDPPSRPHDGPHDGPPRYLEKTDRIISHLSRIIASPSGTDTLLLTVSYASLLTSSVLSSISKSLLRTTARLLIAKSLILPPHISIVLATKLPSSRLLVLAQRLKALSSLISDVRIFARLWGLLGIWNWGKAVLIEAPNEDAVIRAVESIQVGSNIVYQYLENIAYLSGKGVLGLSPAKQKQAWKWSSRFWALHVAMEFIRLYRKIVIAKESAKENEATQNSEMSYLNRLMIINAAYSPMTIHWSLEKGLMSEFWIGLLGTIIGILKTRHVWGNTSEKD
ncbi:hypothetical protein K3495_g3739 [Podosphaera aphanis]|nr:hypothetical protein K3495_g3739 [Podosphaera aphanis]